MCFFLLDIVVVFIVSFVLVMVIGISGVVTEAFIIACALVAVIIRMLEVNVAAGNYCKFFWNRRDRYVVSDNRAILRFGIIFCRINALRNEVLFLGGIEQV